MVSTLSHRCSSAASNHWNQTEVRLTGVTLLTWAFARCNHCQCGVGTTKYSRKKRPNSRQGVEKKTVTSDILLSDIILDIRCQPHDPDIIVVPPPNET